MCCNTQYLGIFCTDQNTSVFGFVSFENGVPTYKYYDTVTNSPYIGMVSATCSPSGGGGDDIWATD